MQYQILMRKSLAEENEFNAACRFFDAVDLRTSCKNSLVIPRYYVLPFYKEVERDLKAQGCTMINSYSQHMWIATFDYYEDLKEYTFESFTEEQFPSVEDDGPFVVKGETNSQKFYWKQRMFAEDKKQALKIATELRKDTLIGQQRIIFRKYIPLEKFGEGANGLPFNNEWRFFFYKGHLVAYGYYWSIHEGAEDVVLEKQGYKLALHLGNVIKEYCNFYSLDIAKTKNGRWVLVEVNDGQQSGLSMIDPFSFYKSLRQIL